MNTLKLLLVAGCCTTLLSGGGSVRAATHCDQGVSDCKETSAQASIAIQGASPESDTHDNSVDYGRDVERLVDGIKADIENLRLSLPEGNNALEKLAKLQRLAPQHDYALNGKRYVAAEYSKLAQDRYAQGNLSSASTMLEKGLALDPESQQLAQLSELIRPAMSPNTEGRVSFSSDVVRLVGQIRNDIASYRLARPEWGNALQRIDRLRRLAPEHEYAVNGDQYVAAGYLRLAIEKYRENDLVMATDYAESALSLNPEAISIKRFVEQMQSNVPGGATDISRDDAEPPGADRTEIEAVVQSTQSADDAVPAVDLKSSPGSAEKRAAAEELTDGPSMITSKGNESLSKNTSVESAMSALERADTMSEQSIIARDRISSVEPAASTINDASAAADLELTTASAQSADQTLKVVYSSVPQPNATLLSKPDVATGAEQPDAIVRTQPDPQSLSDSEESTGTRWWLVALIAGFLAGVAYLLRLVFFKHLSEEQQASLKSVLFTKVPESDRRAKKSEWDTRAPFKVGLLALLFLVFGFGSWSMLVEIDGAVIAPGKLQVDTVKQVIEHPQNGVISEIFVENGDFVHSGQVVIRLDDSELLSKLTIIEDELLELLAEDARLRSTIDGNSQLVLSSLLAEARANKPDEVDRIVSSQQRRLTDSSTALDQQQNLIRKQIQQTGDQIAGVRAQLEAKTEQLAAVESELEDSLLATKAGLIKKSAVYALQKEQALAKGEVGRLGARIGELESRITELELKIVVLPISAREKAAESLAKIQPAIKKLTEQRRSTLEDLALLEIRTPVSGTIHDSKVFGTRSVVKSAVPIMHVIPSDRPVVLMAKVDGTDVDQIYLGQTASLKFRSFSTRSMPVVYGKVESISADAFTDPVTKKPYFDVEISIVDEEIKKLGDETIKAGMPVDVFLATEKRTPFRYLTRPLTDYFGKAFRDA